jgi:hypothetical protein
MAYIQLIVQTEWSREGSYRVTARRTDSVRQREYRGIGATERAAAEDAVGQLLREHTSA